MILDVPVIDIRPYRTGAAGERERVADMVDRTCRDIGFLVITGHGVPLDLIAEVDAVSRTFFDLPLDEKMRVKRPAPDSTRGYIPLEGESVARSRGEKAPGDLNESFMIGPLDVADDEHHFGPAAGKHFAPNLWPQSSHDRQRTDRLRSPTDGDDQCFQAGLLLKHLQRQCPRSGDDRDIVGRVDHP